jgi:hypothetical protein
MRSRQGHADRAGVMVSWPHRSWPVKLKVACAGLMTSSFSSLRPDLRDGDVDRPGHRAGFRVGRLVRPNCARIASSTAWSSPGASVSLIGHHRSAEGRECGRGVNNSPDSERGIAQRFRHGWAPPYQASQPAVNAVSSITISVVAWRLSRRIPLTFLFQRSCPG